MAASDSEPALMETGLNNSIKAPPKIAPDRNASIRSKLSLYPGAMHDFAGANLSSAVTEQENWIRQAFGMPALA